MTGRAGVGKVQAYKRDVVPGRIGGLKMASEDRGPYRLRAASNVPLSGAYGYGRHDGFFARAFAFIGAALVAAGRLTVSTVILCAWLAAVFLYRDIPADLFGIGTGWLTLSHLLVPVGFFCVFMTNRRYGPSYAFAQVVSTLALAAGLLLFAHDVLAQIVPLDSVPSVREAAAFTVMFFAAGFVSIVAFDGARGPHWWTAPLIGYLAASLVFGIGFFAALNIGTPSAWIEPGFEFAGVIAAEGLLLLLPFWAMRRMVPPIAGFGGY